VENLRDYAAITKVGSYIVQAKVYPELWNDLARDANRGTIQDVSFTGAQGSQTSALLVSNRLALTIRPALIPGPGGVPLPLDEETNAVLVREKIPPDEVIDYMLHARQKAQWEKFFLYMDLPSMLERDGARQREWNAESEEGRQAMLTRYRKDLESSSIDGDISAIPMNWTIENTQYNATDGTVVAFEYFKAGTYTEKKQYTYYLGKDDGVWTVKDYSVVNLGTE
jgi:hypothetical protein